MITRIREVRRARGMTLDDVAKACTPPTTPQTIGRLETGTRTVSVGWLNRIASALGVDAADLVDHPDRAELPVVATLGVNGAMAPKRQALVVPPKVAAGQIAMTVAAGNRRWWWCCLQFPRTPPRSDELPASSTASWRPAKPHPPHYSTSYRAPF